MKPLLTYKTAAEILGCSASKVQKMCLAGEIPILKLGNETRIREEDLEAWAKKGVHYAGGGENRGVDMHFHAQTSGMDESF